MTAPIARLAWDSAFFGFPIARVTARRVDEAALAAAERACRACGIRCAYLLLDADDAHGSALAQASGFVLRDVRLTFERTIDGAATPAALAALASTAAVHRVSPARAAQHAALEAIARTAFAHTRFFADERFADARCRDLYAAFLARGLDGAPRRITLADADAGGFVVCHLTPDEGVGTIELIAVSAGRRRSGLGAALVHGALTAFADAGLRRSAVATQAGNVASQRLYQRMGFHTREAALWLHRWFDC